MYSSGILKSASFEGKTSQAWYKWKTENSYCMKVNALVTILSSKKVIVSLSAKFVISVKDFFPFQKMVQIIQVSSVNQ